MKNANQISCLIVASLLMVLAPAKLDCQELIRSIGGCQYFDRTGQDEIYGFRSDTSARKAAEKIMRHTGLPQNFTIMAANVDNAEARIDNRGRRLILYNQEFMLRVAAATGTDWSL